MIIQSSASPLLRELLFGGILVIAVVSNIPFAYGQIIGTDICACQPATYTLTLDFSLKCSDSTVNGTIPGIAENPACLVESRGATENLTDPFPSLVSEIQILELDQELDIVGQTVFTDTYADGDTIEYTSIVLSSSPDDITPVTIPRGFQVTLTALNSLEESLTNTWVIIYTNDCGIFPLLTEGQQIGWTIFSNLGDPPSNYCPLSPATITPITNTTTAPVSANTTSAPTAAPVEGTTNTPTKCIPYPYGDDFDSADAPQADSDVDVDMDVDIDVDVGTTATKGGKPLKTKKKQSRYSTKEEEMKADKSNSQRGSRRNRRKGRQLSVGQHAPVLSPVYCPEPSP